MLAELLYNFFFKEKLEYNCGMMEDKSVFFSEMQTVEKHELAFKRKAIHEQSSLIQWI